MNGIYRKMYTYGLKKKIKTRYEQYYTDTLHKLNINNNIHFMKIHFLVKYYLYIFKLKKIRK